MSQSSPIKPPIALTIAGFDPSSGAGITADLQVFAAHGLFGTACITALTVQSTQGVAAVDSVAHLISPTLTQLEADLPPVGIKIGMLGSAEAVLAVEDYLRQRNAPETPVVLDPVILSSSGANLLNQEGLSALQDELLPLVDWITPNTAELAALSGLRVDDAGDVEPAMRALGLRYPQLHIVATGGHLEPPIDILLTPAGEIHRFEGERVDTTSTHGTGCAFSSALLARLILGYAPQDAVGAAKSYVTEALRHAPGLGKGRGPLHLLWPLASLELRRPED
jgi:hydroxymethylpyrimidine/phosphomethylpyrimidine kinase